MNIARQKFCWVASVAICFALSSLAQPATNGVVKSPVAVFRELLAMTPAQRKEAIAQRPPEVQQRILDKLAEYEILPGELCELRLRETELRWYLRPLMDEPRTNRAARLALIPAEQRSIVEARLGMWDIIPPGLQEQLKNDDTIAGYFSQLEDATGKQREAILKQIPQARRVELEKGLDRWQGMSPKQRSGALAGFSRFFELTPDEKTAALSGASDDERQQMEQTLAAYGKLTPQQRALCISSFQKFAAMSVAERQQFLINAERWNEMSPEERQKWRDLVNAAPIMPPRDNPLMHTLPTRTPRINSPTMVTN